MGHYQRIKDNEKIARLCNWTQKDGGSWHSPEYGKYNKASKLRGKSSHTLRFHEDMGWLFEALDRIEKNGYTWRLDHLHRTDQDSRPHYTFLIYCTPSPKKLGTIMASETELSPETAIFNALVKLCDILQYPT